MLCREGACVPANGEPACRESVLSLHLCVGEPVEQEIASTEHELAVLESRLPDGLTFRDGRLSGSPSEEASGRLEVQSGGPGRPTVRVELAATMACPSIETKSLTWCAGETRSARLEVDGEGSFWWDVAGLPPGVELRGDEIAGSVVEAGEYRLHVTLYSDYGVRARAEVPLRVEACPPPEVGNEPDAGHADAAPVEPLSIVTPDLGGICAGQSYMSAPLEASGGAGPYAWSLEGDSFGFSIDAETGVLSATSPASGNVELLIRVSDGESQATESVTLSALESDDPSCSSGAHPTIATDALDNACAGTSYRSSELVAIGGSGSYTWSLTDGPAWLSLDAATNILAGTPSVAGSFPVTVRVDDGRGATDATLILEVLPEDYASCAQATPELLTATLPDACVGKDYAFTLEATGGSGNHVWDHRGELPSGLVLDGGVLRGTITESIPPGLYPITVELWTGLNSRLIVKTLPLRIRACGSLAYISNDGGVNRLFLTRSPYTESSELSEAQLAPGESVRSFRFSSTTAKLAFLIDSGTVGGAGRLYFADAITGEANLVEWQDLPGTSVSVIDYTWSADGNYLGVVGRASGRLVLAVVAGDTGRITSIIDVAPYLSQLFSVDQQLCYVGTSQLPPFNDVLCHDVLDARVRNASETEGSYAAALLAGARFIPGEHSYLVGLAVSQQVEYRNIISDLDFPSIDHVFSSTLNWAAGLNFDGDAFELIRSEPDLESIDPIVLAPLPGCEEVLAWSTDERTLVCQSGPDLGVFKLNADGSTNRSYVVDQPSSRRIGEARRVISWDGRWFAYDASVELRLVDTEAEPPVSALLLEHPRDSLYTGLEIDARARTLFYHRGSQLFAMPLRAGALPQPVSGSVLLSAPLGCTLSYVAGPDRWCGTEKLRATFFPSPSGDEVAFLDTSRQLHVATAIAPSGPPRRLSEFPIQCTGTDGELRCHEYVAWAPVE